MPVYRYSATDKRGRTVNGQMPAHDEANLEEKLRIAGLWLIKVVKQEREVASLANKSGADIGRLKMSASHKRRELIEFCTTMSFQCQAGITLMQALAVAAQDCESVAFRGVLGGLYSHIESGLLFCEALEKYPRMFPFSFVSVMRSGEVSGNLSEAFEDMRKYLEWVDQMVGDVRQASLYPMIVMVVIFVFVLFLFTFIIPKFAALLAGLNIPLPLLTQITFGLGDFAKKTWWAWATVLVFLTVGLPLGRRYWPGFALWIDRLKLRLPIIGELNHMLAISRFTHNLSILYRSGISILDGMTFSQGVIGNLVVAQAVSRAVEDIKSGSTISEALRREPTFPPLLVRMVAVGETTGSLDKALENVSSYYNQVIPRRIKKAFTVVEPLLMLFLIGIVGGVALSIYLPLLELMGAIR